MSTPFLEFFEPEIIANIQKVLNNKKVTKMKKSSFFNEYRINNLNHISKML
jgi:hypothetical protein